MLLDKFEFEGRNFIVDPPFKVSDNWCCQDCGGRIEIDEGWYYKSVNVDFNFDFYEKNVADLFAEDLANKYDVYDLNNVLDLSPEVREFGLNFLSRVKEI